MELLFGREYTQPSRLFGETIDFMIAEHKHVVEDNPGYWAPLFETMAGFVARKGERSCGVQSVANDTPVRPSHRRRHVLLERN